jgi:hypothetical protein
MLNSEFQHDGFTRLDMGSRKGAEALSLVVKSCKTQMAPMTTDVHGCHDLCSSSSILLIGVEDKAIKNPAVLQAGV